MHSPLLTQHSKMNASHLNFKLNFLHVITFDSQKVNRKCSGCLKYSQTDEGKEVDRRKGRHIGYGWSNLENRSQKWMHLHMTICSLDGFASLEPVLQWMFYDSGSQTSLSATQIWICWRPRDPCFKQHMIKIIIVWMIFSSKLLSSISLSAIYSFLKYLRHRQTKTSSGNGKNIQARYRSPRCNPFFDLLRPMFGSVWENWKPHTERS